MHSFYCKGRSCASSLFERYFLLVTSVSLTHRFLTVVTFSYAGPSCRTHRATAAPRPTALARPSASTLCLESTTRTSRCARQVRAAILRWSCARRVEERERASGHSVTTAYSFLLRSTCTNTPNCVSMQACVRSFVSIRVLLTNPQPTNLKTK